MVYENTEKIGTPGCEQTQINTGKIAPWGARGLSRILARSRAIPICKMPPKA